MAPSTRSKPNGVSTTNAAPKMAVSPEPPAQKYTLWRRSIILGFLLSIYLGYTKGGLYGWVPALLSLYSTAHFLDSYAQYPKGIYARVFLVLTRLQRLLDAEEWVLSPFRGPARAA